MKRLFLAVIATGLIFAAGCKKQEDPLQQANSSWKTNDWVLVKAGISLQGTSCDLYRNAKTGQEVYEAQSQSRAFTYDYNYWTDAWGKYHCSGDGNECWTGTIGGETVIVLPKK